MTLCKGGVHVSESKNVIMPAAVGKLLIVNVVMAMLIKSTISTAAEMFIL